MIVKETAIPGCFEIFPRILRDERGVFVKTFHYDAFLRHNLNIDWREEYYSISYCGVLRGLHFQLPPHDHEKLVYCTAGSVLDTVVDLRKGSPVYGQHIQLELSAATGNMLYLPRGLAHGFYVLSESATMHYKVSSVYSSEFDAGILWSSAGIQWPDANPKISSRDSSFPDLGHFSSPFSFINDCAPL
ncbi:MAG: dTDP-4-dehydrorhamnose 3,5-epimerase [Geobacteraceae bacterium GWC2_53_11]|nr:MAG: dTDP-4-dehydrorhamnose 3,5-epimerase [Geobacteraceae bacterium GWC2_53_11]